MILFYNDVFVSEPGSGILYGLLKIHKINFSTKFEIRLIFASCNGTAFKVTKNLVKILEPLTENCFTVGNSTIFVNNICNVPEANNYIMASFDV